MRRKRQLLVLTGLFFVLFTMETVAEEKEETTGFRNAQKVWIRLGEQNEEQGIRLAVPEITRPAVMAGSACRRTAEPGERILYFDVDNTFLFDGNFRRAEITLEYLDRGTDRLNLECDRFQEDAQGGRYVWSGPMIGKEDTGRWKRVTIPLRDVRFADRQGRLYSEKGGVGDFRIHSRFDFQDEYIRYVEVRIPYLSVATQRLGNLFKWGEPVRAEIQMTHRGVSPLEGTLSYSVVDLEGKVVLEETKPVVVHPGERTAGKIAFKPEKKGVFYLDIAFKQGDKILETYETSFGVTEPVEGPEAAGSPFGMTTYLKFNPEREEEIRLLRDSGIGWVREDFWWGVIEPAPGSYQWTIYDRLVESVSKGGLHLLGLLHGGSGWSDPTDGTPEAMEAFSNFVFQTVKRYKTSVRHWQILNEPDMLHGRPVREPERYAALLKASFLAARKANPDARIVTAGVVAGWFWFLEHVILKGGSPFFDVADFHPYAKEIESGSHNYRARLLTASSFFRPVAGREWAIPDKRFWITEIGWSTAEGKGVSEKTEASYLVRALTLALAGTGLERIFWYNFRDLGTAPKAENFNYGLVREDLAPKPAFLAFRTLVHEIGRRPFQERRDLGDSLQAYAFGGEGKRVWVIWSAKEKKAFLWPSEKPVILVDWMGNQTSVTPRENQIPLTASPIPFFLEEPLG